MAESDVWGTIGVALIQLNDLEGAAQAFNKADFVWADKAYPRPDFDDVYNMAVLAAQLGEADLARDLAAAHHRLAARSDLPHLGAWDKYLCATVAERFGPPKGVTDCLAGIDAKLTGAEFLGPRLLAMRGVAEARLGRIDAAKTDLAQLQALKTSDQFAATAFDRQPELQAELMAAEGQERAAFALLRDYSHQSAQQQAERSSAGVSQVTAELERQLVSAQHETLLEKKVLRSQRGAGLLAVLLVILAIAALIWQRRSARGLKAARQHAEAASSSKSEFLANMSHEIRTPLNGVVAVADMLAAAGLPERERKMAEIIRSSGQSLERLLSDVLDLARVEAGQLTIEAAPFHAADLVRAVAELCRLRADEKGLALTTEIDPALERWFAGDAVRVRQILTNFASNAVKFTEKGAVTIRGEATAPGRLRFSVVDTGVGFAPDVKARLFARFQQADGSITRRFGGSGLGLAISRQLASLMNGAVDCESAPGAGSRFWFEAPFADADAPQAEAIADDPDVVVQGRPVRVLVADDHATNQLVVRMMLEQFGIEVVVVDDGAAGLRGGQARALRCGADGHADAGDGRPGGHPPDPPPRGRHRRAHPDPDAERQRAGRAPRSGSDGRRRRPRRQAGHRRRPDGRAERAARPGRGRGGRRGRLGRRLQRADDRGALGELDAVAVGVLHHRDAGGGAQRHRRDRLAAAVGQHEGVLAVDLEDLEGDVAPAAGPRPQVGRGRVGALLDDQQALAGRGTPRRPPRALRPGPAPRCRTADAPPGAHRQPHADLPDAAPAGRDQRHAVAVRVDHRPWRRQARRGRCRARGSRSAALRPAARRCG